MLSARIKRRLLPAPCGLLGIVVSSIFQPLVLEDPKAHFSAQKEKCGQTKRSVFCGLLPKSESELVSKGEN